MNAVNDAPSFTAGDPPTVLEDSGAQTVSNWATFNAGPANESTQAVLGYTVSNVSNTALFSTQPAVAGNGTLIYTPAANAFGTSTFQVMVQDDGGTASAGVDTSAAQTFTITVTAVNDAPSFVSGGPVTVSEDVGPVTTSWATAISAGPSESGQTLTFQVSNNNTALFAGTGQPAVSSSGVLMFTPAANANGSATVMVTLQDSGDTLNGGVNSFGPLSFTITVTAVNDPPVAQNKTASAQANMKIEALGGAGLLAGVTDADSGVNGCSPTFSVASITSNSGGTVSNVSLSAGTFDFDPNAGFVGTATVNYTVADNGCPGIATSAAATISITVNGPVIWFVNAAVAGPGDGRLSNPFKTLASADAVDAANHGIFLYTGTYVTGLVLNSGEKLIGQGVTPRASIRYSASARRRAPSRGHRLTARDPPCRARSRLLEAARCAASTSPPPPPPLA